MRHGSEELVASDGLRDVGDGPGGQRALAIPGIACALSAMTGMPAVRWSAARPPSAYGRCLGTRSGRAIRKARKPIGPNIIVAKRIGASL